jgi:hypothetical protein
MAERAVGSTEAVSRCRRAPSRSASTLGRLWAKPVEAKVPEIIALFWVVKVVTTAGGEATSDYLVRYGNFVGGGIEVLVFVIGLLLQFRTVRYRAFAYWWLAFSIAIFGTGVADFLHRNNRDVGRHTCGHLLALAPPRAHTVDPQRPYPSSRVLLLGDRLRHVRARDCTR